MPAPLQPDQSRLLEELALTRPRLGLYDATDIARRGDLPPEALAFTVTVPLFARLRKTRGGSLG